MLHNELELIPALEEWGEEVLRTRGSYIEALIRRGVLRLGATKIGLRAVLLP